MRCLLAQDTVSPTRNGQVIPPQSIRPASISRAGAVAVTASLAGDKGQLSSQLRAPRALTIQEDAFGCEPLSASGAAPQLG